MSNAQFFPGLAMELNFFHSGRVNNFLDPCPGFSGGVFKLFFIPVKIRDMNLSLVVCCNGGIYRSPRGCRVNILCNPPWLCVRGVFKGLTGFIKITYMRLTVFIKGHGTEPPHLSLGIN